MTQNHKLDRAKRDMDDDEDKDFTESFGDQTLTGEGTRPVEAVPVSYWCDSVGVYL